MPHAGRHVTGHYGQSHSTRVPPAVGLDDSEIVETSPTVIDPVFRDITIAQLGLLFLTRKSRIHDTFFALLKRLGKPRRMSELLSKVVFRRLNQAAA